MRVLAIMMLSVGLAGGIRADTPRPNVLWVVWDTVRADRLGVYGGDSRTTPFLSKWAKKARVFESCLSTASYTIPSHASMFTGRLPSVHCAHNGHKVLEDEHETVAELLRDAGYRTFLYSANPNVSNSRNLTQGFDTVVHPWSESIREQAEKIRIERATKKDPKPAGKIWSFQATGELALPTVRRWLAEGETERPYFVFVNLMEAHRPLQPRRETRLRFLDAEATDASYALELTWLQIWSYTFGLLELAEADLELNLALYDASLRELDGLFEGMIETLGADGSLENTVVVLTSDHGEHLGDHHQFDHQFTVYDSALHVPLLVHAPGRLPPGRDASPVMNFDLFPTILELTGLERPTRIEARSLLRPEPDRLRLAEEPAISNVGIPRVRDAYPDWDPSPWKRRLRGWYVGDDKLIWGSDGRHQLFRLDRDPAERRDLATSEPERRDALLRSLAEYVDALDTCSSKGPEPTVSEDDRKRLESLGYVD